MWGARNAAGALAIGAAIVIVGCGGGGAKEAVRNALKDSGYEVKSLEGSVDESGQLRVEGGDGSKLVLDVTKEGGEYIIENCIDQDQQNLGCPEVPTDEPLEP